jgi:2-amino-4-hydroxy-6-hydroxymethyldihydropteridine diphosphokinase
MHNHHLKSTEGIYLLLGSNLGDRMENLQRAADEVEARITKIQRKSSVFVTEPWGVSDQPAFFNQVLQLSEAPSPHELLKLLQSIEKEIGKIKLGKWRERLIDIDILYYHDLIIHDDCLTLPHPEIQNRRFTLVPLCEISPCFVHPIYQFSQSQLLQRCPDPLGVWSLAEMEKQHS